MMEAYESIHNGLVLDKTILSDKRRRLKDYSYSD